MKITIYIRAHWNTYSKDFSYDATDYAPSDTSGYFVVQTREIEFESWDDKTLRLTAAQSLRAKKSKVLADAHVEAKEIEEEIQTLLAIEDKSADSSSSQQEQSNTNKDDIPF